MNQDCAVGIMNGCGLHNRRVGQSLSPSRVESSFLNVVQTGSWTHPATYPVGIRCSFPECEKLATHL
jgi:hypothetical protein